MARNKKYTPKEFETIGDRKLSVVIFAAMMESYAWSQLTNNARVLYLYMKLQLYGAKPIEGRDSDCFYFNQALFMGKLYTNKAQFRKDRDMLIKYGFIELVENGEFTRTKSIYKYSSKWKDFEHT